MKAKVCFVHSILLFGIVFSGCSKQREESPKARLDSITVEVPIGGRMGGGAAQPNGQHDSNISAEWTRGQLDSILTNERTNEIPVFYGTNRTRTGSQRPNDYYGGDLRALTSGRDVLEVGKCIVNIPIDRHKMGEVERPSALKFEFKENPNRHVMILNIVPLTSERFLEQLREKIHSSSDSSALLFIHGYNVEFADAARRTAQIAYDINFRGAPMLFSWPSQGKILGYLTDEPSAERSKPALKKFIKEFVLNGQAKKVHLIAHSMGNLALTKVLADLRADFGSEIFNEIILTAPDIDANVFKTDIAPKIVGLGKQVTMYVSNNDNALTLAKMLRGGYPRAGDALPHNLLIVPGINTVDASRVGTDWLGHSYFASSTLLLLDIHDLLYNNSPPEKRNLKDANYEGMRYWKFLATD